MFYELLTIALFVFVAYIASSAVTAFVLFSMKKAAERRKVNFIKQMSEATEQLTATLAQLDSLTVRK